jgi:hypothetical protein
MGGISISPFGLAAVGFQEPDYYGVTFLDDNRGSAVGELGRIWTTHNAGKTRQEQQDSLLSQWKRQDTANEDPRLRSFTLAGLYGELVVVAEAPGSAPLEISCHADSDYLASIAGVGEGTVGHLRCALSINHSRACF